MSGKPFTPAAEIHDVVDWLRLFPQVGIPEEFTTGRHGPCVVCGGKDRARIDNKQGRGTFYCSHCGPGDGFKLVQLVHGCDFMTARKMVMVAAGLSDDNDAKPMTTTKKITTTTTTSYTTLSDFGRAIWAECEPIDRAARSYLQARHCVIPPADSDLRWHPQLKHPGGYVGPALVGLVTDVVINEPISLHRTWIKPDGTKADVVPPRMLLKGCRKANGVIRLWSDEAVTTGLAIGEGIETCLAAANVFTPIWSCIDCGNMTIFPVLNGIECLTVYADNDDAGLPAARTCARRWAAAGREVCVIAPIQSKADINDVVNA